MSLVRSYIWRVTVDEGIHSVSALDNLKSIILFDLGVAKSFHQIDSEQIDFVFKYYR
jgi:hypothetical protein